jgi:ACS family tartrate transporter-like MFS transporter
VTASIPGQVSERLPGRLEDGGLSEGGYQDMQAESIAANAAPLLSESNRAVRQAIHRKNTRRLLPFLVLAFIINFLDRNSVGFAALTMNADLGLTPVQYGWAAGILFAGYCFFEIPSNLALYFFGARRWLARIMITWGLAEAATAWVHGPMSFYLMRFLLGVAEAGFFPGVTYFLSCWYPAQERIRVQALFAIGAPAASIMAGPLSSLLLHFDGLFGLHGWQLIFIFEGLPAVLAGVAVYMGIRDHPRDAHWLTGSERAELVTLLAQESSDRPKANLLDALKDHRVWILASIEFGLVVAGYGMGLWLPQILRGRGLSIPEVGLLAALPPITGLIAMITWARVINRIGRPVINLAICCLVGSAGLAIASHATGLGLEMVGVCMTSIASISSLGILWTIPTRFLIGAGAAGGLAFINSVGTLGGFFGPYIVGVLRQSTGSFSSGIFAMSGILALSAGMAVVLAFQVKSR